MFARLVFRQKCSYEDGLSENTQIQVASRLQARRDLFGINASSQTVINVCNLSQIGDSTARTSNKHDGSDDLGENVSLRWWPESRPDTMNPASSTGFDADNTKSVFHT